MGSSNPTDYHVAQKVVHWLMAFFIVSDLLVAQKFGRIMTLDDRLESRVDHAQAGTIVAILFILRLLLRLRCGAPALPNSMTNEQKLAAHMGHVFLYLLIGLLIVTGLLTAMHANSSIEPFGLFDYAILTGVDDARFQFVRQFHEWATNLAIALILLHTLAAAYHHFFMRDGITARMLKFWARD